MATPRDAILDAIVQGRRADAIQLFRDTPQLLDFITEELYFDRISCNSVAVVLEGLLAIGMPSIDEPRGLTASLASQYDNGVEALLQRNVLCPNLFTRVCTSRAAASVMAHVVRDDIVVGAAVVNDILQEGMEHLDLFRRVLIKWPHFADAEAVPDVGYRNIAHLVKSCGYHQLRVVGGVPLLHIALRDPWYLHDSFFHHIIATATQADIATADRGAASDTCLRLLNAAAELDNYDAPADVTAILWLLAHGLVRADELSARLQPHPRHGAPFCVFQESNRGDSELNYFADVSDLQFSAKVSTTSQTRHVTGLGLLLSVWVTEDVKKSHRPDLVYLRWRAFRVLLLALVAIGARTDSVIDRHDVAAAWRHFRIQRHVGPDFCIPAKFPRRLHAMRSEWLDPVAIARGYDIDASLVEAGLVTTADVIAVLCEHPPLVPLAVSLAFMREATWRIRAPAIAFMAAARRANAENTHQQQPLPLHGFAVADLHSELQK